MFVEAAPILSPGDIILVTGVSGFIGSHIANKLLEAGYVVRGLTRDSAKKAWLKVLFDTEYKTGRFTLHEVPDISKQNSLDGVLRGVSGVIHTASDMSFDPNPNVVIPPTVSSSVAILSACSRTTSVKRVVFTSSCAAAATPKPGRYPTVTSSSWNDEVIKEAWRDPPYEASRGFVVYAASKAASEKESWAWYEQNKPGFAFNTVLPSANFGRSLDLINQRHPSTSGLLQALYMGNHEVVMMGSEYFYVDVEDTARLHLAALLHPRVTSERIFAYAGPYTWKTMQDVMRSVYPEKTFAPDIEEHELDRSVIVGRERAEELLREMGKDGWTSVEECVRLNTEDLASF